MSDDNDTGTWRDRAGRVILDPLDHHGQPVSTPTDRRWLWRIESILAVAATNDTLRELAQDLSEYLAETCEHHMTHYAGDSDIPEHDQCLWCNEVVWAGEAVTS